MADLRGAQGPVAPPRSKLFQFHAVFGKIWQNRILVPPGVLAPRPQGIRDPSLPSHADINFHLI